MTSYSSECFGARHRRIYYNGRTWIRVKQRGGFWSDRTATEYWTNVIGPDGWAVCIYRR
jgi:hypothetical protein